MSQVCLLINQACSSFDTFCYLLYAFIEGENVVSAVADVAFGIL